MKLISSSKSTGVYILYIAIIVLLMGILWYECKSKVDDFEDYICKVDGSSGAYNVKCAPSPSPSPSPETGTVSKS